MPDCLLTFLIGVVLAVVLPTTRLAAQNPPAQPPSGQRPDSAAHPTTDQRYRYRILGIYDQDSGEPVPDVEVSDILSGLSSRTTTTGTVSLLFLPEGGSLVRMRKVGYEIQTVPVSISPADTAPVTMLIRRAVTLEAVVVKDSASKYLSPALRGAEERMKSHSGGSFVTEEELRKHDESTMANVITATVPGLTIAPGRRGESFLRSARVTCLRALSCGSADCYVAVYQDGVQLFEPTQSGAASRPDFSRLQVTDYALVEFYPGAAATPAGFGNSPCGTLVLWTREK